MILVGEVKELAPGRTGHKLVIKHLPGFVLLLDEGLHRRLHARFESELALWNADAASHLVAIATFSLNPAASPSSTKWPLMVVSENWIPYESIYEKMLVDALATLWRRSVKGLRYGLPANQADRRRAAAGRAKSCRALHRATGCRCGIRGLPARAYGRAIRNAKLGLATG